jgi:Gpi18-like mannosyltransferase/predicted membrane-bound dolichyl-phosphate-mannose-protein mannosyltransferase
VTVADHSGGGRDSRAPHLKPIVIVLALGCVAAAAPAGASGPSGKFTGVVAALAMLAVIGYAFADYLAPLLRDQESGVRIALVTLAAITIVKFAMLPLFPGFGVDVGSYESWALQIADVGPAHMYQAGYFLDYPPGYLYALWLAGAIAQLIGASGDLLRVIVESPALVADFVVALLVFACVKRGGANRSVAYAAMLLVALNPVLLFDTVVWGQSDSVLAFTMLLSVVTLLESQYELCWGIAAISVLVKPQGLMLVPVLAFATPLEVRTWMRSALAFVFIGLAGIAAFQIGHPWHWILDLYTSTAAYYHETSVNAFNLLALLGGLRQQDTDTLAGISYFDLGMSLLVPLYLYVGWILWTARTPRRLMFAAFIAIFGFFMLAPRMHERYLCPALVFAAPLALESATMMVVFAIISLTGVFNLAYVLHALNTVVFLDARDGPAMLASALNLVALTLAVYYGLTALDGGQAKALAPGAILDWFTAAESAPLRELPADVAEAPEWSRVDTIVFATVMLAAVVTRFWHLGKPAEIVFDEVHFVGQARHYLHNETFLDPHPPLAKLIIAAGILLFGDHPWSWRAGNAVLGCVLVGVTYLLARRIAGSRLVAALASAFIVGDGLFLVDSRVAVIDIVYITFAAISYWLLFKFIQTPGVQPRRRILPWLGVALGLCVGAKLYIPAVTFLLVMGFLAYVIANDSSLASAEFARARRRRIAGAVLLTGSIAGAAYLAVFTPHFALGWWGGIADLFHYYKDVIWYEKSVAEATHPYSSPWWSWPLMLRPVAYWQAFPKTGPVATIWGGGNPILWWGALTAVTVVALQAIERPSLSRSFLVIGYAGYLVIWVWIGRTLFLYHYMPSVYLGYIALAWLIAQCIEGVAEPWEHLALLITLLPGFILGFGAPVGGALFVAMVAGYAAMLTRTPYAGRYVAAVYLGCALAAFIYFWPIWVGIFMNRDAYYARMWLQGSGLRSWI